MPTYQYACKGCDHRFEAVQSFSDSALTECPECTGTLRKVFSSVGIVFKGSGFYRTDSRAGAVQGESNGSKESSSSSSSSESSSSGDKTSSEKSDKKPTAAGTSSSSSTASSTAAAAAS